ncbi:MAG: SAM-dependent methyltransferase [Desulfobacterales bacterium]|jgi:methyltransferase (TIGR00027 family)
MKVKCRHHACSLLIFSIVLSVLVLAVCIPATRALKPGEVSLTAEMLTGLRAIAAMDPDEKVRNPDYLAEKFLTPNFWFFGPLVKDYSKSRAFVKFYRVNRYFTANAMTWHIDAILQKMAAKNVKQVVNIGAGFDSRPYRFREQMPNVRFFEVDQPATLNRKKEMVKAAFGGLPAEVTYIPVDYRTRTIFDSLTRAGYDENQKTLFIWEGVLQYTDRKVVDLTLQSIAKHSAPGSEVVFDYVFDEVVKGDFSKYRGARFMAVRLSANGEPLTFGIAEGQANEFVTQRGLKVISDLGSKELAQKYLVRSDGSIDGKPTAYKRIMHAAVDR